MWIGFGECATRTGQKRLRLFEGGMELLEMPGPIVKLSMTSLGEGTGEYMCQ